MSTKSIELSTPDGPMRTHVAHPTRTPTAGVIVIMEAFGLNNHIAGIADRLAAEGFLAVAPDLYHRYENKVVGYDELDAIFEMMGNLLDSQALMDVDAAIDYLASQGISNDKVGITGFCMGGRITFLTAISRPVAAAVTYYGGAIVTEGFSPNQPQLSNRHGEMKCPWLGLFGDMDSMIPTDKLEELRSNLEHSAQPTDLVRYPEADHGFFCDERPSYNAAAASDAWQRTLSWFRTHL